MERCAACALLDVERAGELLEVKNPSGLDVQIRFCPEHMIEAVLRLGIATGEYLNEIRKKRG